MGLVGIGIGSGGTHTTCAVMDTEGSPLPTTVDETNSSISDVRGRPVIRTTAQWITDRILDRTKQHDQICVWIGAAASFPGVASDLVREEFESCLRDLEELRPDCEIYIANDGVSILKAPPTLSKGVVAIVGTGSITLGTHPSCGQGVVRRGGHQFPVGDQGAGVWMTTAAIRLLIDEIETQGGTHYHSALLDRLCDYFDISAASLKALPDHNSPLTRADALAAKISAGREDSKRYISGFVHPHLLALARGGPEGARDPVAARVVSESVRIIGQQIRTVSEVLAAYTADNPDEREKLSLVVGGSIAANEFYRDRLAASVHDCKYLQPMELIGDAAGRYSQLAMHFLRSDRREQRVLSGDLDLSHEVLQLM